ncbi:MAG: hypothetical protein A3H25_11310 [Sphingomonadales bacterium RIFCSPLOWO2_12_FULL_63_15]|nr:MAG: hypothetical protein A3H25_11310 [Sphingomonadales bacterium RIFCSPLOWO2_12_FULL_63_15]
MTAGRWRSAIVALVATFGTTMPSVAHAGLYQDDLSRCIVAAAKAEDRTALLRWVFAAMATNPTIQDMTRVAPEQAAALSANTAKLMQRLLLVDCRKQAVDAIKYEQGGAIQHAFGTLGQIAMSDLMREDSTSAYMGSLDQHLDKAKWAELMAEAGVKAPAPDKAP